MQALGWTIKTWPLTFIGKTQSSPAQQRRGLPLLCSPPPLQLPDGDNTPQYPITKNVRSVSPIRLAAVLAALILGFVSPSSLWAQSALENPEPGSFQSGIGLVSGWSCTANRIDVEINGTIMVQAAYGTLRGDTTSACGDANNGFGLLVNWNLLGNGSHTLRVLADGVEIGRSTFTVVTLGLGDFPRGLSGSFTLPDFPQAGKSTRIQWQESLQNFVITNASGIADRGGSGSAGAALENPQPGSFQSGIGTISGWKCTASRIDIEVDGTIMVQAAYGTLRGDTTSACGDANNGFGLLVNWNLLGDGAHTLRALADGVEIARATFTVATLGLGDFPRGLSGSFTLPDFPQAGKSTNIRWQESLQNFVITNVAGGSGITAGLWRGGQGSYGMCLNVSSSGDALVNSSQCTLATVGSTGGGPAFFAMAFGPGDCPISNSAISSSGPAGISITSNRFSLPGNPSSPASLTADGFFSSPNTVSGSATLELRPPIVPFSCSSRATYTAAPAGGSSSALPAQEAQEAVVEERSFVDPTGQETIVGYNEAGVVVSIQIFIEETVE